jgi:hypothetical protein
MDAVTEYEMSQEERKLKRKLALIHLSKILNDKITGEWLREHDCALLRIRHKALLLPEMDSQGNMRDEAEWVYISMNDKIDSGEYGEIYYLR